MNIPRMTIGQAMRMARLKKQWTVRYLAKRSGVSKTILSRYELDKAAPGIFNLVSLADALGLPIDEYIGRRVPGPEEDAHEQR